MHVDYNDVVVFAEVVRARGFTAAGQVLDLPASAVSRRVARLEKALGYALLHRTTRRVGLTDAGRLFYERIATIAAQVDAGRRAVAASRRTPSGVVRITIPPDEHGILWSLLSPFVHTHPDVDLEVIQTLEKLDLLEHDIDVALRGGPAPDTADHRAVQIFESRILLAASPEYLAAHGIPERVEDLSEHLGVCLDGWVPNAIRRLPASDDGTPLRIEMRNRLRSSSLQMAQRAALEGLGIAPVLEMAAQDALNQGRLVEVLPGALPPSSPMWAISPLERARSAAVTALVDTIVAEAQSHSKKR
ncbi:MAG: LysR family transcriptional regulator [Myxococcota bacterium]